MLDDMFAFIDLIVELNEEGASCVIQAETFFEFLEKLQKYITAYLARHGQQ